MILITANIAGSVGKETIESDMSFIPASVGNIANGFGIVFARHKQSILIVCLSSALLSFSWRYIGDKRKFKEELQAKEKEIEVLKKKIAASNASYQFVQSWKDRVQTKLRVYQEQLKNEKGGEKIIYEDISQFLQEDDILTSLPFSQYSDGARSIEGKI